MLLWPTGLVINSYSYGQWGAYASSNDVNVLARNLLRSIESVLVNSESQAMVMHEVSYSITIHAISSVHL